jgi:glycosyltransferase involved in cell wall biosynthesis
MSTENKNNLKIAMLAASLPPMPAGGAEMQALQLARELSNLGHSVFFITPGDNGIAGKTKLDGIIIYRLHSIFNKIFKTVSNLGKKKHKQLTQIEYEDSTEITNTIISNVRWPTIVYYNIFFLHSLLLLWTKRKSFDILHAHTMEWSAIVATRLGKILGKEVVIKDSTMNGFKSLARFPNGKNFQKIIIKHSYFVAMTRMIEENLKTENVPEAKIFRIPNGVSIIEGEEKSSDGKTVLFVGNLYQQPAKGIDILLKAWALVNKKAPEARLNIVGKGDLDAYLKFARSLSINSSVSFHGKQTDLQKYYRSAQIFVLPSRREGMSNALLEAMMYGLPCVATDISGNQDLIQHNKNGILVPPANVKALAEGIYFLLANSEQAIEMGVAAQHTIKSYYSMQAITEKYICLYNKILSSR